MGAINSGMLDGSRWRSLALIGGGAALAGRALWCSWRSRKIAHTKREDEEDEEEELEEQNDTKHDKVCAVDKVQQSASDAEEERATLGQGEAQDVPEIGLGEGMNLEAARAAKHWATYNEFLATPGNKCPSCWLMKRHCCCEETQRLPPPQLRPHVVVVMHYSELGKHLGSNTAKVLFHYGAELIAWGVEEHAQRLHELTHEDPAGTIVLFPGTDAITAHELKDRSGSDASGTKRADCIPRVVLVLDGGWRDCKRINESINPAITRCVVTEARREEYGGTRKYGTGKGSDAGRVQTAAAFIALMQELDEDAEHVAALKAGLALFMGAWESQICRSKTWVS